MTLPDEGDFDFFTIKYPSWHQSHCGLTIHHLVCRTATLGPDKGLYGALIGVILLGRKRPKAYHEAIKAGINLYRDNGFPY